MLCCFYPGGIHCECDLTVHQAWSSFWHFDTGVDSVETSSYKTLDINISHPVRATQLAIDCFLRQKLGHGVVVIVTSVAAQTAVLAAPLYTLSKHAISGFTRSLADLEPRLNIRVNAVAPGSVKTPIWSEKLTWIDEEVDSWVPAERLAEVMLSLVRDANNVGGTILECGTDTIRRVEILNDPGPRGRGFSVANFNDGIESAYVSMEKTFGNKRQPYYCDVGEDWNHKNNSWLTPEFITCKQRPTETPLDADRCLDDPTTFIARNRGLDRAETNAPTNRPLSYLSGQSPKL